MTLTSIDILLIILLVSYVIEIITFIILKENFDWHCFIPFVNVAICVLCIFSCFYMLDDYIKVKIVNGYKIKRYKGYYYICYNGVEIERNQTNVDFEKMNGFWVPYVDKKIICFETRHDAGEFINKLEAEKILNKLSN